MMRNLLGGVALGALVVGFVASPIASLPVRAQVQQQLPSVADLAERLLPSVVEISVQTKAEGGEVQGKVEAAMLPAPSQGAADQIWILILDVVGACLGA